MRFFVSKIKNGSTFSILLLLILMGCANRGNPTGGEIDTEPPIVIKSSLKILQLSLKQKKSKLFSTSI